MAMKRDAVPLSSGRGGLLERTFRLAEHGTSLPWELLALFKFIAVGGAH